MKNYAKKYLSLFVAVLMAVTMLIPTAVFAEDTKPAVSNSDATLTASATTVKTGDNFTLTAKIAGDSLKNFKSTDSDEKFEITADPSANVTVGKKSYDNNGTFTIPVTAGKTAGKVTFAATFTANSSADKATATAVVYVIDSNAAASGYYFADDNTLVPANGTTLKVVDQYNNEKTDIADTAYAVESSDEQVVSARLEGGVVKVSPANKAGKATITLRQLSNNGTVATCTVYSDNGKGYLVNSIDVAPSSVELNAGATSDLKVTAKDADGNALPDSIVKQVVGLSSAKSDIATVDTEDAAETTGNGAEKVYGRVTGVAAGTTTVKAIYNRNDALTKSVSVKVNAVPEQVTSVELSGTGVEENNNPKTLSGKIGKTYTINAAVKDFTAANKGLDWVSSDESVATVAAAEDTNTKDSVYPATITVNGYGKTTIKAIAKDGSKAEDSLTFTVEGLSLTQTSMNVNKGDTFYVPYTEYNATVNDIESSNTGVATVDYYDGMVTVRGYGRANITVTYTVNGERKEATLVLTSGANNGTAVYRVYNPNSGEHFYTTDKAEKDGLVKLGWNDEGIGWYGAAEKDGVAVYRLYNANAGEHHYTTSASEKATLVAAGWKDEGVSFYAAKDKTNYPVYRNYNPNAFANNHNYSTNVAEYRTLLDAGWKDEGVAFYAVNPGTNG